MNVQFRAWIGVLNGTGRSRIRLPFRLTLLTHLVFSSGLAGCAEGINSRSPGEQPATAPATPPAPGETRAGAMPADDSRVPARTAPAMPRRIIYNATVELVVESLTGVEE